MTKKDWRGLALQRESGVRCKSRYFPSSSRNVTWCLGLWWMLCTSPAEFQKVFWHLLPVPHSIKIFNDGSFSFFFCWISAILNMFFRKLWEKAPNNSYQKYPGELFAYFPLRLCTACTITPIISIRKWVGTHPQWIMISMVHVMVQLKCLSSLIFSYRVTKHSHQTKQSEKQDTQCHNNQGGGSKFGGWEGLHTNSTDFEKQK